MVTTFTKRFFVPKNLAKTLAEMEILLLPAIFVYEAVKGVRYEVPGFKVDTTDPVALERLRLRYPDGMVFGKIGGRTYELLGRNNSIPATVAIAEDLQERFQVSMFMAEQLFKEGVGELAVLTGLSVRLHVLNEGQAMAPFPVSRDTIDVVMGAFPPGQTKTLQKTHICGVRIADEGKIMTVPGPAVGYGTEVLDDNGTCIGQIIDHTIYLFFPLHKDCVSYLTDDDDAIFSKMLSRCWNVFAAPREGEEPTLLDSPLTCILNENEWDSERYAGAQRYHEKLQTEAEELAAEYGKKMHDIRLYVDFLNSLEQSMQKNQGTESVTRRIKEWEKVLRYHFVERLVLSEKGFEATTRPLTFEHHGTRYVFGRFVVRICSDGEVFIRALEPTHPRCIPHPHVTIAGKPCFGNVNLTLEREIRQARNLPKAMLLVLRWLEEGYDETLARPPITEWPTEEDYDAQLLAPGASVQSDHESPRDSAWGRLSRQLDRLVSRKGRRVRH